MSNGELAAYAKRVRSLRNISTKAAKSSAPLVLLAIKLTASLGKTPGGAAWKPTKDGGRPLANASQRLTVEAVGAAIIVTLTGVEVLHNWGTKRLPKRQILPDPGSGGLPKTISVALKAGAALAFVKSMFGK